MSIRSRKEILDQAANEEGASNEAILMAALNESQEEYRRLSEKILTAFHDYNSRLEAIEAAVRASNAEKAQDYTKALKGASETILGDIKGQVDSCRFTIDKYKEEIAQAKIDLRKARQQKEQDDNADNAKWLAIAGAVLVVAFAIGGYIANYAWSAWYDVPETLSKLDAINNGIWQLLNKH